MADAEEVQAPDFGSPDVQWDIHTGDLPDGAIKCGEFGENFVYAGRVRFENQILIGTVYQDKRICVFTANGLVHESSDYEIMNVPVGEPLKWENIKADSSEERNFLASGVDKNGDVLYVGRVVVNKVTYIGWVDLEKQELHVAKDGQEQIYKDFEILIHKYLHRICICPPAPPGYRSRYE